MSLIQYEKDILDSTKEFAEENSIQFTHMTGVLITNTIRKVRADEREILSKARELIKAQENYIRILTQELICQPYYTSNDKETRDKITELKKQLIKLSK